MPVMVRETETMASADPVATRQVADLIQSGKTFGEAVRETHAAMEFQPPRLDEPAESDDDESEHFERLQRRWVIAALRKELAPGGPLQFDEFTTDELLDWICQYDSLVEMNVWCARRFGG